MIAHNLQEVADRVVKRAQRQGYVVLREVYEELTRASIAESLWKDVLALARASLTYHRCRYYYSGPVGEEMPAEQEQQLALRAAVLDLIGQQPYGASPGDRREQGRIDFTQAVTVITEDNREFTLITRDLSATGVRLMGTRCLLGQKVRVVISQPGGALFDFLVRVLWTCPQGEDLVENGGMFLSVARSDARWENN